MSPSAPPSRSMTKPISVERLGFSSDKSEALTKPNNPMGSSLVSMVTTTAAGEPNLAPAVTESSVTVKVSRCSGTRSSIIVIFIVAEFCPLEKRTVPRAGEEKSFPCVAVPPRTL